MIIVVLLLSILVIGGLAGLWATAVVRRSLTDREERARIERETRRAEYRLHRLASDAFSQMLDVARHYGHDETE